MKRDYSTECGNSLIERIYRLKIEHNVERWGMSFGTQAKLVPFIRIIDRRKKF
jgi:hypothetical protein